MQKSLALARDCSILGGYKSQRAHELLESSLWNVDVFMLYEELDSCIMQPEEWCATCPCFQGTAAFGGLPIDTHPSSGQHSAPRKLGGTQQGNGFLVGELLQAKMSNRNIVGKVSSKGGNENQRQWDVLLQNISPVSLGCTRDMAAQRQRQGADLGLQGTLCPSGVGPGDSEQ